MCACINYFDHVVFMSDAWAGQACGTNNTIYGPTIQTYDGSQGPGTMLLKLGTVPEIRGPLRPMYVCF